jgi:hypothetical protein
MIKNALFSLLFLTLSCWFYAQPAQPMQQPAKTEAKFPAAEAFAKSNITYKIINSANKTYGYDILADGKLLIHQSSVPGMPGNNGFESAQASEKVAKLVIKKIHNGEMPPTITIEEMKKLKVIK